MDSSSSHSALTTYGGWAVLLALAGYVFVTYSNNNARRSGVVVPAKRAHPQEPTESAPPKKKVEKAIKPKKTPKPASTATTTAAPVPAFNAEEVAAAERKADQEFARQLASTHAGHTFTNKKADEKRQKSVKLNKAEQGAAKKANKETAPAPVGGVASHAEDADDDLSSQASPVIAAEPSANDVSDMLEPSASGPSVLRLTGTDDVKTKSKKAKAPEVVESKKQRQNRKKAEAAKAAREEDEQQRKTLMEQQRRTARIAEGRAAKDGSGFMAAQESNAWTAQNEKPSNTIPLLDTFDAAPAAPTPAPAKKEASWAAGVPSEEEQIEAFRQEDSWSEVKTKKKGKQSAPTPATEPVTKTETAAPKAAPTNNGVKKPLLTTNNSSFAALSTDETEDVDEEWDV